MSHISLKEQDKLAAKRVTELLKYTRLNLICMLDFLSVGKPDSLAWLSHLPRSCVYAGEPQVRVLRPLLFSPYTHERSDKHREELHYQARRRSRHHWPDYRQQ